MYRKHRRPEKEKIEIEKVLPSMLSTNRMLYTHNNLKTAYVRTEYEASLIEASFYKSGDLSVVVNPA